MPSTLVFWFRFEWQHHESPYIHGIVWFPNAPDVEKLLATEDDADLIAAVEDIISYADDVVSTTNPAIAMEGSNPETAPSSKTKPQHACNKPYSEVEDFSMDLVDLIATCQCHTWCSAAYTLRKKKGKQYCRFGYPNPLQQVTTITTENGDPSLLTARKNDCLLNSYNPVQLSANVDMQYVVSRSRVINYVAKYATKSEPSSKSLKTVYSTIMKSLKDDDKSLKVVQKILINSVGERNMTRSFSEKLVTMLVIQT